MARLGPLGYLALAWLSRPPADRRLYRLARRLRPVRIVELGLGPLEATARLISVAQRYADGQSVHYTGIDLFEASADSPPGWTLKGVHQRLAETEARIRLVPGDPAAALPAIANTLARTDLLLLRGVGEDCGLGPAWFYVPRMLHGPSCVLRPTLLADEHFLWEQVPPRQIARRAAFKRERTAA